MFLLQTGDGLFVGNQGADSSGFSLVLQGAAGAQMTDALGGLLVKNVVHIHFLVLYLAGLGQGKALRGAAPCPRTP